MDIIDTPIVYSNEVEEYMNNVTLNWINIITGLLWILFIIICIIIIKSCALPYPVSGTRTSERNWYYERNNNVYDEV